MELRWEMAGRPWPPDVWHGFSGTWLAALAYPEMFAPGGWAWKLQPGPPFVRGDADTPEAARADAEAAWAAWCEAAGLATAGEAEARIEALRRALEHAVGAVDTLGAVAEREHSAFAAIKTGALDAGYAALRATNRPPASGLVPPYKTAGEGDGA